MPEVSGSAGCESVGIPMWSQSRSPTRTPGSFGRFCRGKKIIARFSRHRQSDGKKSQLKEGDLLRNIAANCQEMEERSPRPLLEPDVWTGTAEADVLGALREKRAEIHRGSRRRYIGPHYEAGYTSAIVIADPDPNRLLQ